MYGGHQTLDNAELIVDNLGKGSKAVGGAGSVGNDHHVLGVLFKVYAAYEGGGLLILCGSGDNYLLRAALQMRGGTLGGAEYAGRLYNILGAAGSPFDVGGVSLRKYGDILAVYNEFAVFGLHIALKLAMDGVVLHHINHVVEVDKRVVDAHYLEDVGLCNRSTENKTSDAAKTIDTYFDCHSF